MEAMMNKDEIIQGVTDATDEATRVARDVTATAKSGVVDTIERIGRVYVTLRNFGLDDALARVGLQKRRAGLFQGALGFGAGFVAGAATAALVTPQSGRATRRMIASQVRALFDSVEEAVPAVEDAVQKANSKLGEVAGATKKKIEEHTDNGAEPFDLVKDAARPSAHR